MLASKEFNLDSFMNTVVDRMEALTSATGAVIELIEGDDMVYKAASGSVASYVHLRLKRDGSLSGLCVSDREMKISPDTSKDDRVDAAACMVAQRRWYRLCAARKADFSVTLRRGKSVGRSTAGPAGPGILDDRATLHAVPQSSRAA